MRSNWKPLGSLTTAGTYDYLRQLITLDARDLKHFESLGDAKMASNNHQTLKLLFHESTHWLDHVSTLWGQRSLALIFNAINARALNMPEEFWRIAEAKSHLRRIHYPRYFTVVESGADLDWRTSPWMAQLTCGLQFGPNGRLLKDRPILFYRFKNSLGESICRTPISVAALMEANATMAELWVTGNYLVRELGEDERDIEDRLQNKEATARLYNPELSQYSVAAHLLANRLGLTEGFPAYRLTSTLGTLALNLPLNSFGALRIPKDLNVAIERSRLKALVKQHDRGFAFFVLVAHAPKLGADELFRLSKDSLRQWVESTVAAAGLPALSVLDEQVRKEQAAIVSHLIRGPEQSRAYDLLSLGRKLYEQRGVYGNNLIMEPLLDGEGIVNLPPILLGDWNFVQIGQPIQGMEISDMKKWLGRIDSYEKEIDEFLDACVY